MNIHAPGRGISNANFGKARVTRFQKTEVRTSRPGPATSPRILDHCPYYRNLITRVRSETGRWDAGNEASGGRKRSLFNPFSYLLIYGEAGEK